MGSKEISNDFIEECKDEVLNDISNKLKKENKYSDTQKINILNQLKYKLYNDYLLSEKVIASGRTSSDIVNKVTENLYYDVYTSFKANDKLNKLIDEYTSISLFNLNNINVKLDKNIERINDFNEILKTKGNPRIITESFIDNESFSDNNLMYRERYNEYIDKSLHINYDFKNSRITLPLLSKTNMLMYDNGVSTASIKINKQIGENFLNINSSSSLDCVIDSSSKSYWKNTVLTDRELNVEFSNIRPSIPKELKNFYYGISNGGLLEIEINFEAITNINCIELTPCTKYPMELVAIKYSSTDDINVDLNELIYPDNENSNLRSKIMKNSIIYNFDNIICKRMYLIFNQINYEIKNFIINTKEMLKNEIYNDVYNPSKERDLFENKSLMFKPNYLDRTINKQYLNDLNKFAVNNKSIDFYDLFYSKDSINKNITKNAYEFGLKNISTYYVDFANSGVYVSNFIDIKQNIETISILTDEIHEKASDGRIDTDIEYYITFKEDPEYYDWHSILPKNKNYVYSEMLQLDENDLCSLRFKAKKLDSIYMNEILLVDGEDYKINYEGEYIESVEIFIFNHRAIYKASYEPIASSKKITLLGSDVLPEILNDSEVILCDDNNLYELSNVPYVDDYNKTFVKIINCETGEIVFQENKNVFCITNYVDPANSYQYFYGSANKNTEYQYYTYENKIFFDKPIPFGYKVEISYNHYISKFRLKAILRRNNYSDTWLSPILNKVEYSVTVV